MKAFEDLILKTFVKASLRHAARVNSHTFSDVSEQVSAAISFAWWDGVI